MEGKIEGKESKTDELRKKFVELLEDYNNENIALTREKRKSLAGSEIVEKYQKSKFRRSWLANVFGYLDIAEMYGIEPDFFLKKKQEAQNLLPASRGSEEFDITPEIVERTDQILREAIEKLS